MKVSAQAAETASTNGHGKPDSPALAQLKAAIEPEAVGTTTIEGEDYQGMAGATAATAVLEAGEDEEDIDDDGGDIDPAVEETIKKTVESSFIVPAVASPVAPAISQPAPTPAAPAPYDPIAEVDEEIAENNERIVAHAIRASELDTMLKATKKSLKTAADEGVELAVRRAGLLLQQKEKAEREAARTPAFTTFVAAVTENDPAKAKQLQEFAGQQLQDAPAAPAPTDHAATESTEEFHARITEQFAPDPAAAAADASPTPEQERYDHEFRSLAIEGLDGLTPKICEILQANQIFTVGAFQDWPKKTGCEYTQMSGGNAKLTEVRYEKIMDAMMAYMKANPRPEGESRPAPAPVVVESVPATVTTAVVGGLDVDDI